MNTFTKIKTILANLSKFATDPYLMSLRPALNNGKPVVFSGGMAVVMKMVDENGKELAVKLWVHQPSMEILDRIKSINKKRPYNEVIHYGTLYVNAIEINGKSNSIFISPWLTNYVSLTNYIDLYKSNKLKLKEIYLQLEKVFIRMKKEEIVHGDLHHDNIRIGPNNCIRIIDIDTLIIYDGHTKYRDTSKGLGGYQHPLRKNEKFILKNTDDISMLVILSSLSGIISGDIVSITDDHMGVSQKDLHMPEKSILLDKLKTSENERTREIVNHLISRLEKPYSCFDSLYVQTRLSKSMEDISLYFAKKAEEMKLVENSRQNYAHSLSKIKTYFNNKRSKRFKY